MSVSAGSVIVVGAGPAGAGLAYVLASRGVSVTLLERQHDFAREFRGEVLLPSGSEALREMGLGHVVPSIPHVAPTTISLYANARPVFHLPVEPAFVGPYRPVAVSQPAFLEAVIRARACLFPRGAQHDGDWSPPDEWARERSDGPWSGRRTSAAR